MPSTFDFYNYYLKISQDDIILSYKGPITSGIMAELSRDIRERFSSKQKEGKKLFAIFMELAQNIHYYSAEVNHFNEREDRVGTIVISQSDKYYALTTGNLVKNQYVDELIDKCTMLNSLDRESLRKAKREYLEGDTFKSDNSKGAGIGLIQVALTADNPFIFKIEPIDSGTSFFLLSVNVDKVSEHA